MRDQLKRLEELQRYDAQIQELNAAMAAIPAKLETARNDLARVETLLNNERTQLAEAQRYYNEQKGSMEVDETNVTSAKHKLSQSKNPKEFTAAQREIEHGRESLATREQEIAKLVEAIASKEKVLADRTSDVQALRDTLDKDAEVARAGVAEIEKKIATIRKDREKVAANVKPDVLKKYSAIRMRRGLAMTSVVNGTCRGCNMNIPPQLFNVLQRGNSLEVCPYCHRIIYWDHLMKDEEPAPAAPANG